MNELFIDRAKKAKIIRKGVKLDNQIQIAHNVEIGENTWIGPFTILDGTGGLKIGSYCSISTGVQIYSHNTVKYAISGGIKPYEYNSVVIENNCFIGKDVFVGSQ